MIGNEFERLTSEVEEEWKNEKTRPRNAIVLRRMRNGPER